MYSSIFVYFGCRLHLPIKLLELEAPTCSSPAEWSHNCEARNYCRKNYVDLAVIENVSELTTVSNLIGSFWVWIGLYRQPFRWSDNRISFFKNWINGEPDNKQTTEQCVVEYSDIEHHWLDANCAGLFKVICQQGKLV
uniref:C-type lectin domain-containing protein n=1 Tax=Periophthalmus magnuspinnatus TaxID=409849 RepID=A0A3B4A8U8_9GOBI